MDHSFQHRCRNWLVACLVLSGVGFIGFADAAEADAAANRRIYLYQGADREQKLIAAAMQEGSVSIYTSMQLPDAGPLTQAFEKNTASKPRSGERAARK